MSLEAADPDSDRSIKGKKRNIDIGFEMKVFCYIRIYLKVLVY